MHEMGLIDAILKTVDGVRKEQDLQEVYSITLEVGALSGAVPRFLSDCYEAVADGTPYEKTELKLEIVPGTLRCNDCVMEFPGDIDHLKCPKCGGLNLTPVSGTDLTIKEIEAS